MNGTSGRTTTASPGSPGEMPVSRRRFMAGSALLGGAAALWPHLGLAADAPDLPPNRRFDVTREGSPIGTHTIAFARRGDDLQVDVDVALKVKIAFITVFRLTHHNTEIWRNGVLRSIATDTDDNGTPHKLRGEAQADGFRLEDGTETRILPASIVPTSYWNPILTRQSVLLNSVNGKLLDVKVARGDREPVPTPQGAVPATKYAVRGDLDLDLWYDGAQRVVRLAFESRGSVIDYELRA